MDCPLTSIRLALPALALVAFAASTTLAQHPGSFSKSDLQPVAPQAQPTAAARPLGADTPAAARSAALDALFAEMWQDRLEHSPEFATSTGDKRYNDRLDDQSAAAYNADLARGFGYIARTLRNRGRRPAGAAAVVEGAHAAAAGRAAGGRALQAVEMPVNQFAGIQVDLPQLQTIAPFATVKDYDDYIARMHAVPAAFQQVTDSIEAGIADHRAPPRFLLEKVLAQTRTLAAQSPRTALSLVPWPSSPRASRPTSRHRSALYCWPPSAKTCCRHIAALRGLWRAPTSPPAASSLAHPRCLTALPTMPSA